MKTLKFTPNLVPLVVNGSKTCTWRLFDDKNLTEGDMLSFIDKGTGQEFAKAKITSLKNTTFGKLTEEDSIGHEGFESKEKMFETYSGYYKCVVNENTPLEIVRFELLES